MYKTTATKLFANANKDSANATQRIKRQRLQLANAKANMAVFINVMRPLLGSLDHMSIVNGYDKPTIYVHARGLESFKTGRIVGMLQVLEALGTAKSTEDWASSINRDFEYTMSNYNVMFCAFVKEDSATCRKIEVGTETQTIVKYAIQCD